MTITDLYLRNILLKGMHVVKITNEYFKFDQIRNHPLIAVQHRLQIAMSNHNQIYIYINSSNCNVLKYKLIDY